MLTHNQPALQAVHLCHLIPNVVISQLHEIDQASVLDRTYLSPFLPRVFRSESFESQDSRAIISETLDRVVIRIELTVHTLDNVFSRGASLYYCLPLLFGRVVAHVEVTLVKVGINLNRLQHSYLLWIYIAAGRLEYCNE